jgi:hypothetical protein
MGSIVPGRSGAALGAGDRPRFTKPQAANGILRAFGRGLSVPADGPRKLKTWIDAMTQNAGFGAGSFRYIDVHESNRGDPAATALRAFAELDGRRRDARCSM